MEALLRRWPALALSCVLASTAPPSSVAAAQAAESLEWNEAWLRFQPWEYAVTGGLWTEALVVRFAAPLNRQRGTFSLDVGISDALTVSGSANDVLEAVADSIYIGSMAYRLVDSIAVPGLGWGSWDVAFQMTMIDLEDPRFERHALSVRRKDCPGRAEPVAGR